MKGCFYGPHHNDTWDYVESCFDIPPGGWWRLHTNRRGNVLQVTNATQHHTNFLAALREIVQQYPELPDAIEFDGPVESVATLLAMPKQRIQDVVFLHGTTDAFLDDILVNGLRPRSETNVCPTYGARYDAPAGRCDWIYLTTQHNTAAMAARDAVRQHGGAGIILAVGPGLRESYAEIDEDADAFTVEESLATLGNIAYRRTISPQLLRVHEKLVNQTTWQKVGSTMLRTALVRQELSWLKRYLTMSDADKGRDLADRFSGEFVEWLQDEFPPDDTITTEGYDVTEVVAAVEDGRYEVLYDIVGVVAEAFLRSADRNPNLTNNADTPSYFFFDYQGIVKNQWLIHFTDQAYDIVRDGFTVGVDDLSRLGLTVFLNQRAKPGGYNFAYTLDAFERYGRRESEHSWKYGREAVLFRASGLELWHSGDEEPQVIFWGPSARDRIELNQNSYYEWDERYKERVEADGWVVDACDGAGALFGAEKLTTVVGWVVRNFDQYRNKLVC